MSNKLDKLFKEKLEENSLQPSAQAWEKVEAHLGKKNKMVLWLRVAAAIAVVGLLTFAAFNWNSGYKEPKQEIVKKEIEKVEPVKEEPKEIIEKKEIKKQRVQPKVVIPVIEKVEEQEQVAVVPEPTIELVPEIKNESKVETKKGITLTYSLPPVKKEEAPAIAEAKPEKKTGLERVIEIAKEVKSGDALGELRQAKDDIFALDFRKDKKRN
ncbi:MAG: hypothetical protein WDO14_13540 [Bacteroidota bacterium]